MAKDDMNPLWTRSGKRSITAAEGCHAERCAEQPEHRCTYVDQWGWRCLAPSCRVHGLVVSGHALCLRHAGLCLGLGGDVNPIPGELEDEYEQTPSLLIWAARGVDTDMRKVFADTFGASSVTFEQRIEAHERPRWLAEWRADGVAVALVIEGYGDPLLTITDSGERLILEAPEWLRHHRYQLDTALEDEVALRRSMFQMIATTFLTVALMRGDVAVELDGSSSENASRITEVVL